MAELEPISAMWKVFGNNLLEMMSYGLPAVINKYEVYKEEIEQYGFDLPAIDGGGVTEELVDSAYRLLTDIPYRKQSSNTQPADFKRKARS